MTFIWRKRGYYHLNLWVHSFSILYLEVLEYIPNIFKIFISLYINKTVWDLAEFRLHFACSEKIAYFSLSCNSHHTTALKPSSSSFSLFLINSWDSLSHFISSSTSHVLLFLPFSQWSADTFLSLFSKVLLFLFILFATIILFIYFYFRLLIFSLLDFCMPSWLHDLFLPFQFISCLIDDLSF